MTPGLLSVILPNYNHAAYVAGQIIAVLNQSYRNFELIVVDDASADNSVEVIQAAIQGDSRAKLIRNEKNLGVNPTTERGRSMAGGEYLYMPGADDLILPGFFEKCVSALTQAPQAGLCFTVMAWLDNAGLTARPMPVTYAKQAGYFAPDAFCEMICGEHVIGAQAIVRLAAYQQAMPTPEAFNQLRWVGDWFMNTVIGCRYGACHIPEPLVAIRQTGTNYGHGMNDWEKQKEVVYTVLRLLKSEPYRDVITYFTRGGLFCNIPFIARAVLANPEFWDVETMMLTQKAMVDWALERRQIQQNHWQQGQQRKTLSS